jgi:hypothetical protein
MKDSALLLARRLLLVISILALLVTIPFVISPQLATEFGSLRVQRGGSYLCTDQYCSRYIVTVSARVAEAQPTPARTTWVSVALTTQPGQL